MRCNEEIFPCGIATPCPIPVVPNFSLSSRVLNIKDASISARLLSLFDKTLRICFFPVALTPETTAEIIRLLMNLSDKLGIAYLFISHDLTTVKYICHRVVVLYLGKIVEIGTKEQVFNDPKHPYARALLASHLFPDTSNRRVDREIRESLKGEIPSPVTENLPKGCYLYGRCAHQVEKCGQMKQELKKMEDCRYVSCWRVTDGELSLK